MKTTNTTKTLMALATLIPCLGLAEVNNQELSDEVLQTLRAQSIQQDTAQIRFAPEQTVKDAIKKLNGKATLDFGNKQIKIDQQMKSGGVVIGSGADGLVATNNSNPNGPIVVNPPVTPQTSITVVGRAGAGQNDEVCARKIVDGRVNTYGKAERCTKLNNTLRLSEGSFILDYNEMILRVDLKNGENKIIPLREIQIPKQNGSYTALLTYDFFDPKTQIDHLNYELLLDNKLSRLCTLITHNPFNCPARINAEYLLSNFKYYERESHIFFNAKQLFRAEVQFGSKEINEALATPHYIIVSKPLGKGNDGDFFSVLPGVYQIVWTIDGQEEVTQGIHVQ